MMSKDVNDLESLQELNESPTPPATAPIYHSESTRNVTFTIREKYDQLKQRLA